MTPVRPCYYCNLSAHVLSMSGTPICLQCARTHEITLTTFAEPETESDVPTLSPAQEPTRCIGSPSLEEIREGIFTSMRDDLEKHGWPTDYGWDYTTDTVTFESLIEPSWLLDAEAPLC